MIEIMVPCRLPMGSRLGIGASTLKCCVGEYGARILLLVQDLVDLFVVGRIVGVVNQNPFLRSDVLITPVPRECENVEYHCIFWFSI